MSSTTLSPANGPHAQEAPDVVAPTQLSLLSHREVSPRFRLSHDTRARGLRHVAEIRARLAASTGPAHATDPAQQGTRAA